MAFPDTVWSWMHGCLAKNVPFSQRSHRGQLLSPAGLQSASGPLPPTMTANTLRVGVCRALKLLHLSELVQVLRSQIGITVTLAASHQKHAEPRTCLSALLTYTPE